MDEEARTPSLASSNSAAHASSITPPPSPLTARPHLTRSPTHPGRLAVAVQDTNKSGFIDNNELVDSLLNYIKEKIAQQDAEGGSTAAAADVEDPEEEEEEEAEMPEEFSTMTYQEQQSHIKMKAAKMMAIGLSLILVCCPQLGTLDLQRPAPGCSPRLLMAKDIDLPAAASRAPPPISPHVHLSTTRQIFSDPMVEVMSNVGDRLSIPPFYVAFTLAPLASNASELLASIAYAGKKSKKTITVALAALEGAACMNNTFCLAIFMLLVYLKARTPPHPRAPAPPLPDPPHRPPHHPPAPLTCACCSRPRWACAPASKAASPRA